MVVNGREIRRKIEKGVSPGGHIRATESVDGMGLQEKWLSAHSIEELQELSKDQSYPGIEVRMYLAGEYIFQAGDPSDDFYIVLAGSIGVYRECASGPVLLDTLRPSDMLGEMGCLQGTARSASAIALDDARLLVIGQEEVDRLVKILPRWFVRLVDVLIDRLRAVDARVAQADCSIIDRHEF